MEKLISLLLVLLLSLTLVFCVYAEPDIPVEPQPENSSSEAPTEPDIDESSSNDSSSDESEPGDENTSENSSSSASEDANSSSNTEDVDTSSSDDSSSESNSSSFDEDSSEESDSANESTPNVKTKIYADIKAVVVKGDENAFSNSTIVTVEKLTEGEVYEKAAVSFSSLSKQFTLYEIKATENGEKVAPNGNLSASFAIPALYDINRVAVFLVSDDGSVKKLPYSLDRKKANLSATLDGTGYYAVVELNEVVNAEVSNNSRLKSEVFVIICAAVLLCLLAVSTIIFSKIHNKEI